MMRDGKRRDAARLSLGLEGCGLEVVKDLGFGSGEGALYHFGFTAAAAFKGGVELFGYVADVGCLA